MVGNGIDDPNNSSCFLIQVSESPLPTYDAIHTFLSSSSPNCGAIATFAGMTRNTYQNKTVLQLHYEGYTSMATSTLSLRGYILLVVPFELVVPVSAAMPLRRNCTQQ